MLHRLNIESFLQVLSEYAGNIYCCRGIWGASSQMGHCQVASSTQKSCAPACFIQEKRTLHDKNPATSAVKGFLHRQFGRRFSGLRHDYRDFWWKVFGLRWQGCSASRVSPEALGISLEWYLIRAYEIHLPAVDFPFI